MSRMTRRDFVKVSAVSGAALAVPGYAGGQEPFSHVIGANDEVRIGIVGLHSHGKSHIRGYQKIPKGVRIVALCDPDRDVLDLGVKEFFNARDRKVDTYTDIRKLLERKDIDAISGATPNHWHALSTIWGCQAGKDVCVEKPASHNIWEGRKMVEAARKYGRMVQVDLNQRANDGRMQALEYARKGNLGKILRVHGFVYKQRKSIGKVAGPRRPPTSVDYDLWCGPAPKDPVMRKRFHYDWHWQWAYGGGETANNGPHMLDVCRHALGQPGLPRRVMSFGGRFGYDDDGETPNTQVAILDYEPAPIYFEVRGLPRKKGDKLTDANHMRSSTGAPIQVGQEREGTNNRAVIICEEGYVSDTEAYDNDGKPIKEFKADSMSGRAHFVNAIRSRQIDDLKTDVLEGHLSTSLCHMANIAYRIGQECSSEEVREALEGEKSGRGVFDRFQTHLSANGIDLEKTPASLGAWLEMDSDKERFVGGFGVARANELLRREYREPFVVREEV